MNFTYESQGTNTYLVYAINPDDSVDTMSLGMLTNNKISGLAQTLFTQMDDQKFIKYNVSAKISVRQFFNGAVNKKRLLGVFKGIAEGLLSAEDYMIDPNSIILDMDYIFADVSTCEATLICLPISNSNTSSVDFGMFFKNIMMNTQFDPTENSDHVAKIFNFLNSSPVFSLTDFKALIDSLEGNTSPVASGPVQTQVSTIPEQPKPVQPKIEQPQPAVSAKPASSPVQTPPITTAQTPPVMQPPVQQRPVTPPPMTPPPSQTPVNSGAVQPGEKKISMLGLLMHYNKENAELYKAQKAQKKGQSAAPKAPAKSVNAGFAVPGAPAPNPGFAIPGQQTPPPPSGVNKPNVTPAPRPQTATTPQPQNRPAVQTVEQVQKQPVTPQPVYTPPMPIPQGQSMNFGETTILGGGKVGETTVLNGGMQQAPKLIPHLIRKKNNERIELNKPVFRIGKEKSYVDYFISDNTAVSRSHANIITREGQYFIVDTNSTNHTFVNAKMLQSNVEVEIKHGDKIRLGNEDFEFKLY